ncbi:MAG: hypothetical protein RIS26_89 [Actinomycetota bacterium]|jgi:RimJ/RimL family protein N-acetyltransferase
MNNRVELHLLTLQELESKALLDREFENPHGVYSGENLPRTNRLADVQADPDRIRWYYRIIVDRSRNLAVGSVSFHASPDERGMVEIGIGIAPQEQGKGFAQEALRAMWDWVIDEPGVRFLRYTVSPTNLPSMAIIEKFGFPLIGEQIDEEDGLELIYEISVDDYREKNK